MNVKSREDSILQSPNFNVLEFKSYVFYCPTRILDIMELLINSYPWLKQSDLTDSKI